MQRRHFNTMALRCSYGADAEPLIQRLTEQTPEVIERVSAELPERFPGKVAERIFKGLKNSAAKLGKCRQHSGFRGLRAPRAA